jgi:predicted transcriptional regulator
MPRKKKNPKTQFLSVRVTPEIRQALEKIAASEDRTLSWLVGKIVREYLESRRKKERAASRLGRRR